MATQTQTQTQDEFKTSTLKSKAGHDFEVGTKVGSNNVAAKTLASHGPPFTENVNWPVDDTWHTTTSDFANTTGITTYIVGNSSSPFYDYYIQIATNQDYDYSFTDKSPDTYSLNVVDTSSDHIVRYNSSAPTIDYVSGK